MKTLTVNIVKKNRLYYAAEHGSYKCRIKIDDSIAALEIGEQKLLLNDISVKSKYGIDRIYSLVHEIKDDKIVSLTHDLYNKNLVDLCRNLGGTWDAEQKSWIFSEMVADKLEEVDELFNGERVTVEITTTEEYFGYGEAITFIGYTIARAFDRDAGARLGEQVCLISGKVKSGGSRKNWATIIEEGSVFRLKVPKNLLQKYTNEENNIENFSVKIINE